MEVITTKLTRNASEAWSIDFQEGVVGPSNPAIT